MVKIICENNKVKCKACGSILQFQESDIEFGAMGRSYIVCPACSKEVELPVEFDQLLTLDNIEYPKHFYSFERGVEIDDGTMQMWIDKAAKNLKNNPEETFYIMDSGNAILIVLSFADEYRFIVAKNYEDVSILKENSD